MKSLKNILFNDTKLNQFRTEVLKHMKWLSLLIILFLLIFQIASSSHNNYGIAIKQNIWQYMVNQKHLPDSIYYLAKGILPIKKNDIFSTLILGTGEELGSGFRICNYDFVVISILLIFAHFFAKDILRYGPFDVKAMKWLKLSVKFSVAAFFCKSLLSLIILWYFDKKYSDEYRLDDSFYSSSNGWIFFAVLLGFFLNIFNYGRKLQADNDLTV